MAHFIKSAFSANDWIADGKTEFCFSGRSNVGKSSIINAMAKNKIAITSKTPGRTQLANFYQFDKFRLIDLPGYGFSNNSKDKNSDIANIIDTYLSQRVNLFGVFQICDAGVITEMDKKMSIYFNKKFINHFIVLNKIDKISKSQLNNNLDRISKFLMVKKDNILSISAKNNIGINLIFKKITEVSKDI